MDEKTFWKDKKVLVTGGAGFIGGNILRRLKELETTVIGFDLHPNSLLNDPNIVGDLVDQHELRSKVLHWLEPEIIFHLAAQPIVPRAKKYPLETMEDNVRGTYNLLTELIEKTWLKSIVVASTDKVYGENLEAQEYSTYQSCGIYEASKICMDILSKSFAEQYEIPLVITRCGNVYGKGDNHRSRIIPGILHAALTNQKFQLRSDGKGIREYVYVDDVVNAYLLLGKLNYEGLLFKGDAFNIFSTERGLPTLELVNIISNILREKYGILLEVEILNEVNEISAQSFGGSALENYGWFPQWDLESGLEETIDWYKEYYDRTKII